MNVSFAFIQIHSIDENNCVLYSQPMICVYICLLLYYISKIDLIKYIIRCIHTLYAAYLMVMRYY